MCTPIVSKLYTEQLLTCPYNRSHRILRFRMPLHLVKCGRQYEKENPHHDMKNCIYNFNHVVPEKKLNYHMAEKCEDRIKGDRVNYQNHEDASQIRVSDIPDIECDEYWNLPTYQMETNPEPAANSFFIPVGEIPQVECDDDWK
ncbi:unnamed protein product [Bemisia tabaci]|uniref:CHHC U11-48K-type domain-containing protein n=1 Tax=Bemisia tabaci TaxID=7038 RepID=A0A9P0AF99_BEMTA|nr:unnamed protein product [Bemisia tabaci]